MKQQGMMALAVLVAATPVTVVAQERLASVAKAMPTRYIEDDCGLRAGHFLVSSGITYLAVASGGNRTIDGTTDPEKVETALANGIRVISQAINENGQDKNGAAWYYLGRLYLQGGDVTGADSAFTRAQQLVPACGNDIKSWRQRAWIPLATPAAEYANQGKADSAVILFKQAARMVPNMPQAPYNLGVLYANAGETDSAIAYFTSARDLAAADPQYNADRNSATFNLAAMYQRAGRHGDAVTQLKQYLEWSPNDSEARRALAQSLRANGQNEEAAAVEEQVLVAATAAGTLTSNDLMTMGVNQFNDKNYAEAAATFEKLRAEEPNNRDALYNLANSYYAVENGPKLIEVGTLLVALEPLSEENRKLLAQGYRFSNEQDLLISSVTELLAMPTAVHVERFQAGDETAVLSGVATGRQGESDGNPVAPKAQTIVVEFLNAAGETVTSSEVELPALEPGVRFEWSATGSAAGVNAWRYRVK